MVREVEMRSSGGPIAIESGRVAATDRGPDPLDAGREQALVRAGFEGNLDFGRQHMQLIRDVRMRIVKSALQLGA